MSETVLTVFIPSASFALLLYKGVLASISEDSVTAADRSLCKLRGLSEGASPKRYMSTGDQYARCGCTEQPQASWN
jgi:hypothetical protein